MNSNPKPEPCPSLHLAPTQRAWSPFHWSAKATESVRGDSGQAEVRQTENIWESSLDASPASPHHCRPCARTNEPVFHFRLLVFSREAVEVYSMCNGPPRSRNAAAQQQERFLLLAFLLSPVSICTRKLCAPRL